VNVLVIDDDMHIREMLAEVLEDEGYAVACAADGQEALSYLHEQPTQPCLILLDLMMPRMNGWEFREAQRQDPALAPIPVITISAHADPFATATPLDVTAHLPKPIDINRLLTTVQQWCE
jgi:two-component system, chemotaxis family, chemotaxis protein CheY